MNKEEKTFPILKIFILSIIIGFVVYLTLFLLFKYVIGAIPILFCVIFSVATFIVVFISAFISLPVPDEVYKKSEEYKKEQEHKQILKDIHDIANWVRKK